MRYTSQSHFRALIGLPHLHKVPVQNLVHLRQQIDALALQVVSLLQHLLLQLLLPHHLLHLHVGLQERELTALLGDELRGLQQRRLLLVLFNLLLAVVYDETQDGLLDINVVVALADPLVEVLGSLALLVSLLIHVAVAKELVEDSE